MKQRKNWLALFVAIFAFSVVSFGSAEGFINVAGGWRQQEGVNRGTSIYVTQDTNGKILTVSGKMYVPYGDYMWGPEWETADTPWGINGASGTFTWTTIIRQRVGNWVDRFGPYVFQGSANFAAESELSGSYNVSCNTQEWPNLTNTSGALVRETWDPLVAAPATLVSLTVNPVTLTVDGGNVLILVETTGATGVGVTVANASGAGLFGQTIQTAGSGNVYQGSTIWEVAQGTPEGEYTVTATKESVTFTQKVQITGQTINPEEPGNFGDEGITNAGDGAGPENPLADAPLEYAGGNDLNPDTLPTASPLSPQPGHAGDPVNTRSGNFFYQETDLVLKARLPLKLTRFYNSLKPRAGAFGRGWSCGATAHLEFLGSDTLFVNGDGSRSRFENDGTGFTPPAGVVARLTHDTAINRWRVVTPSQAVWTFDGEGRILTMAAFGYEEPGDSIRFLYDQNHRLTRMENPAGQWLEFSYDGEGRVTGVADGAGRSVTYAYDDDGDLIGVTGPLGETTGYEYDADGRMTRITQADGRVTQVGYTEGKATTVTEPSGNVMRLAWATDSRMVVVHDNSGATQTFEFDENGLMAGYRAEAPGLAAVTKGYLASDGMLVRFTNPLGQSTECTYTAERLPQLMTDAMGHSTEYTWDADLRRPIRRVDALGRTQTWTWNVAGQMTSETDPAGQTTSRTYDDHGNFIMATDVLGRQARYLYDATGSFLQQVVDPAGGVTSFTYDLRGNLLTVTDPAGRQTAFAYDAGNRLTRTTLPDGRWVSLTYGPGGRLVSRRDSLGRVTGYAYDGAARLVAITRPDGAVYRNTFDAAGRKASEIDPLGRETRFEYDGLGRLVRTVYPDGAIEHVAFDAAGQVIGRTDERGNTTTFEYDPLGRVVATVDPTAGRWERIYDAGGRQTTARDPLGRTTTFLHDVLDRLIRVERPDGSVFTDTHDGAGRRLTSADPLGHTWAWAYDALDRIIRETGPDGASSTWTYDPTDLPLTQTDPLGRRTLLVYDAGGRVTAVTDAAGGVWRIAYDGFGRLREITDPEGGNWGSTYDDLDRLLTRTDPLGHVTRFEYDVAGRLVARTNALGRRRLSVYDLRDRVISEVDPEGGVVTFGYDEAGNQVRQADGAGRVWRWEYDGLDRPTAVIDPLGHTIRTGYDAVGNPVSRQNARGQTTTFAYDSLDRLTRVVYPSGDVATFGYDAADRELSRSWSAGRVARTYDPVGRVLSESFAGGPFLNEAKTWAFAYDPAGNRVQAVTPEGEPRRYGFDALDRLTRFEAGEASVRLGYDGTGRLTGIERPGARSTLAYDLAGRLTDLRHERLNGREKVIARRGYVYDAADRLTAMTNEDGAVTRYEHDGDDRLTLAVYPDGIRQGWRYNGAGDRTRELFEVPVTIGHGRNRRVGTETRETGYAYDAAGRLTGTGSDTFAYDADGNLSQGLEAGAETRYFWSPDNRLVRVEKDAACDRHGRKRCDTCPPRVEGEEYGYLPEDWRRITRKADGQTYVSVYEGDDESHEYLLMPPVRGKGQPAAPRQLKLLREFLGGPGTDDLFATKYHGRALWHLTDALGSTIALTNRGGHAVTRMSYDPFGNLRWPDRPGHGVSPCGEKDLDDILDRLEGRFTLGQPQHDPMHFGRHFAGTISPYLFAGRRFDVFTRLYQNRNRLYNPRVGRFVSPDPMGFFFDLNLYAYANNAPLRFRDAFGFCAEGTPKIDPIILSGPMVFDSRTPEEREERARWWEAIHSAGPDVNAGVIYVGGPMFGPGAMGAAGGRIVGGLTGNALLTAGESAQAGGARLAREGFGNIGSHGPMEPNAALGNGLRWLGQGYREVGPSGSGVFRSADGLRQFRLTSGDLLGHRGGPSHVHFEALDQFGNVTENLHINLSK